MTDPILHEFSLYRSGWTEPGTVPWPDNQLWAKTLIHLAPEIDNWSLTLEPKFGHAASYYRVQLAAKESAETGWLSWQATLDIDTMRIGGPVPLSWYAGSPSDWPSGVVRFPETYGPQLPRTFRADGHGPRGVWTLAVRRAQ